MNANNFRANSNSYADQNMSNFAAFHHPYFSVSCGSRTRVHTKFINYSVVKGRSTPSQWPVASVKFSVVKRSPAYMNLPASVPAISCIRPNIKIQSICLWRHKLISDEGNHDWYGSMYFLCSGKWFFKKRSIQNRMWSLKNSRFWTW